MPREAFSLIKERAEHYFGIVDHIIYHTIFIGLMAHIIESGPNRNVDSAMAQKSGKSTTANTNGFAICIVNIFYPLLQYFDNFGIIRCTGRGLVILSGTDVDFYTQILLQYRQPFRERLF
jgi:hypothetical protein